MITMTTRKWSEQPVLDELKDNDELLAIDSSDPNPATKQKRLLGTTLDERTVSAIENATLAGTKFGKGYTFPDGEVAVIEMDSGNTGQGFLWGSNHTLDSFNVSFNYYRSGGVDHIPNPGYGTSRLRAGSGYMEFRAGSVNTVPETVFAIGASSVEAHAPLNLNNPVLRLGGQFGSAGQVMAVNDNADALEWKSVATQSTGTFLPALKNQLDQEPSVYQERSASYVKIGDVVFVQVTIAVQPFDLPASTAFKITELPFQSRNLAPGIADYKMQLVIQCGVSLASPYTSVCARVGKLSKTINLQKYSLSSGFIVADDIKSDDIEGTQIIVLQIAGHYFTDE